MSKVLITGINGFLGRNLASLLVNDHEIYGITHRQNNNVLHAPYKMYHADLKQPISRDFLIDKPIVIHASALMPSDNSKEALIETNINGTKNILEWSVRNNAKRLIFISSGSVYGFKNDHYHKENDPKNPIGLYGYTKYIGENLVKMYHESYGIPVTIFRLFFPYGSDQENGIISLVYNKVKNNQEIFINEHERPHINPIHIDDVVNAIFLAMKSSSTFETYNLCGDETVSFSTIVRIMEKMLNKKANTKLAAEDKADLLGNNQLLKEKLGWKITHTPPTSALLDISHMRKQ